jgi:hypothetical protein
LDRHFTFRVERKAIPYPAPGQACRNAGQVVCRPLPRRTLERFRFICCHLKITGGGIYFHPGIDGLLPGTPVGENAT